MKKGDLEKILSESESVKKAVKKGVPLNEAVKIYLTANRLVEEGTWVQLYANKTVRSEDFPQCTSVVRYWGSKELLRNIEKDPDKFSLNKLKKMYRAGLLGKTVEEISTLGKTHELVLGSSIFPEEEWLRPSVPEEGRKVYHRHWEIEEMYRYAHRKNHKTILFSLLAIFALSTLFLLLGPSNLTGLTVLTVPATVSTFLIPLLCLIFIFLSVLFAKAYLMKEKD